jgi:N6-L-threonylcarbamoyladenine synthase
LDRIEKVVIRTGVTRVAIGGGVAANSELRTRLEHMPGITAYIPPRARCTDNGSMIAHCGRLRLLNGQRDDLGVTARSGWVPGAP